MKANGRKVDDAAAETSSCGGGAHRCGCAAAGAYAPSFARRANVRPAPAFRFSPIAPTGFLPASATCALRRGLSWPSANSPPAETDEKLCFSFISGKNIKEIAHAVLHGAKTISAF